MIILSVGLGIVSAITGYLFAILADVSIAGSMATMAGVVFGLIWVFAPNRGLISRWRRISKQRFEIDVGIMLTHVNDRIESHSQVNPSSIASALGWTFEYSKKVCEFALERKLAEKDELGNLSLTESGRKKAEQYTTN